MPHRLNITALTAGLIVSFAGCQGDKPLSRASAADEAPFIEGGCQIYVRPNDPLPPHDAYFEWAPWHESAETMPYCWMGQPIGYGPAGFREVISRLKALPQGSRVLVYPDPMGSSMMGGLVWNPLPPWHEDDELLWDVMRSRSLVLIFSAKDHEGRPLILWESATAPTTRPAEGDGPGSIVYLEFDEPVPPFDYFITWRDTGWLDAPTFYYWGTESLARGEEGIREVLSRLAALPPGSRILMYPTWEHCLGHAGLFAERGSPWEKHWPDLLRILQHRELVVILSPRDHLGQICPESVRWAPAPLSAENLDRFQLR